MAAAADEAHRAGVALSIDHPGRVRVSLDGDVALAFPATLAEATPAADVRGVGAALYALLVDRWPLPETGAPLAEEDRSLPGCTTPSEPRLLPLARKPAQLMPD